MDNQKIKASPLPDLGQFTGTIQLHKWSNLFRATCTDGALYVAKEANAYWLLDAIASYQIGPVIQNSEMLKEFQIWILKVDGNTATLVCLEDSDQAPVIEQEIPFTDFPLSEIKFYVESNVILLPSEH